MQFAAESVQILCDEHKVTFLQMWLQHTELCHEIPDGTEAQSSFCLRTISSANRTTHTAAQLRNPSQFLQASWSLAMNLLYGQCTGCLGTLI